MTRGDEDSELETFAMSSNPGRLSESSLLNTHESTFPTSEPLQPIPHHGMPALDRWLNAAFFIFGCINNCIYVVILSAALDLVDRDTPTGVVLVANIAPALVCKVLWPYFVPGRVRYKRRINSCSIIACLSVLVVAYFPILWIRLGAIASASFISGLGEMTFLQLSTGYPGGRGRGARAVGYFASGTGAAGLVGALLWWLVRGLGVRIGLSLASILPMGMCTAYYFVLPPAEAFEQPSTIEYTTVPTCEEETRPFNATSEYIAPLDKQQREKTALSTAQKFELAKPLVLPYMIPLFFVYMAEYTINQGVAPTLVYPIPTSDAYPIFGRLIFKLSDYYPLWQLIYQSFVFISRSSIVIFRVPPIPKHLIPIPTVVQVFLLCIASLESGRGTLEAIFGPSLIITVVFCIIACEGISGGLSYVNVFHRVNVEGIRGEPGETELEKIAKTEFRIASIGFADTSGILMASLVAIWLEPVLCADQIGRGKTLCKEI